MNSQADIRVGGCEFDTSVSSVALYQRQSWGGVLTRTTQLIRQSFGSRTKRGIRVPGTWTRRHFLGLFFFPNAINIKGRGVRRPTCCSVSVCVISGPTRPIVSRVVLDSKGLESQEVHDAIVEHSGTGDLGCTKGGRSQRGGEGRGRGGGW